MHFPQRKESSIEASVCAWAKKHGIYVVKLQGEGGRGLPDRMFLFPGGRVFFIEFKAAGRKASPLQRFIHDQFRELGFHVEVHDNRDAAIAALQGALDAA